MRKINMKKIIQFIEGVYTNWSFKQLSGDDNIFL